MTHPENERTVSVLGDRWVEPCRALATEYQIKRAKLTTTETQLLGSILEPEAEEPTLTNALGLIELTELTPLAAPQPSASVKFQTEASQACLLALDELVHEHRQTPIKKPSVKFLYKTIKKSATISEYLES